MMWTGLSLAAILVALTLIVRALNSPDHKTELIVSAAASLKSSLDEIKSDYEQTHPDIRLMMNYGSSGALQKQIEQGAPTDLFISASTKQMDALISRALIDDHAILLNNDIVLIVPFQSRHTWSDIQQLNDPAIIKIAIGQPETVPAGQYAKETLEHLRMWNDVEGKLVFGKDVRQVLTHVETGNADAGFVYKTDALASGKVRADLQLASDLHSSIEYPVGIVKSTEHIAESTAFYEYLFSEQADAIFQKYGFKLP